MFVHYCNMICVNNFWKKACCKNSSPLYLTCFTINVDNLICSSTIFMEISFHVFLEIKNTICLSKERKHEANKHGK